jgi:hypothetical protein
LPYDALVANLLPTLISCAVVLLVSLPVSATPLQVRARSELTARVDEAPGGVILRGHLRADDGVPIGGVGVRVRLKGAKPRVSLTRDDGSFEIALSLSGPAEASAKLDPTITWEAEFDGDENSGPVRLSGVLEGARRPSDIDLTIEPRVLSLDSPAARARVSVRAGESPMGSVPVFLRVGEGAELVGATDSEGDVVFLVHPGTLDQQGRLAVSARWAGDHRYGPARVDRNMRVERPTRLTLRVAREGDLDTGRYRFSGRLGDHRGAIAGATIALKYEREDSEAGSEPTSGALARTNERGHFVFAVSTHELSGEDPSVVKASVVYVPGDAVHAGAVSASSRLPVPGPPGVSARWYVAVTMLALALLILLDLIRSGGLGGWASATLWRSLPGRGSGSTPEHASEPSKRPMRGDWVTTRLTDARTGVALEEVTGSTLTLVRTIDGDEVAPDDLGNHWGPLASGDYRLSVEVPGYLGQSVDFAVPHDGSLDPLHRRLVEVRGHVLLTFIRALQRLGVRFRWGRETPSEAMARCLAVGEARHALQRLHQDTEALWFADRRAVSSDVERADLLLAKVEEP